MGREKKIVWLTMATLTVAAVTELLVWLEASMTTAGMVFLVLVVSIATLSGTWQSLYTTVLCATCFDYFFLPPLHTFQIVGVQQWVALGSFLAGSLVVSRVAELARQQKVQAEQRHAEVERLYALSQRMMLYEEADPLLGALPGLLAEIFSLDAVALYVCSNEGYYVSPGELPMGLRASLRLTAAGPNPQSEAVGEFVQQPLLLGMRPVGALAWRPAVFEQEEAAAVGAQVALAVARSMASQEAARMEVEREAERLRTALTDSLTHELRTPLTSIRAAATTLTESEGLDEESRQELAEVIDEESERLDRLIGEAVEMAEIDANSVKAHAERNSVRALLDRAVEASGRSLAAHTVEIEVEDEESTAWFDAHLLSRVLRHLLENAAAYTPAGSRVRLRSRSAEGRLFFEVEDNGPGIEAKDLPHIFERFYRGQRRRGARKGSGMGLAIVRAILEAQGGGIEAESTPGQGTRFRFWIPLAEEAPASRA